MEFSWTVPCGFEYLAFCKARHYWHCIMTRCPATLSMTCRQLYPQAQLQFRVWPDARQSDMDEAGLRNFFNRQAASACLVDAAVASRPASMQRPGAFRRLRPFHRRPVCTVADQKAMHRPQLATSTRLWPMAINWRRGTACICDRCRRGKGRCGPPWAGREPPSRP